MPEHTLIRRGRGLIATFLTAAAITALILGSASAASAEATPAPEDGPTISVDKDTADVGDTITVTVAAESVVDLYAYQLSIGFDPALLSLIDGSEIFPAGGFSSSSSADGVVSAVATRLGTSPGLSGAQSLVSLTFTALAPGTAKVTLLQGALVDSAGASAGIDSGATTSTVISGDGGGGTDPGTGGGNGGTGSGGSTPPPAEHDPLATTGGDAGPWIVAAAAALAAAIGGIVLIVRRRAVRS